MSGRGRDSANMDNKDLDFNNCCTGMRLVAQRIRARFLTQLLLREKLTRDQAYSCSSTLTRINARQLKF